MSPSKPFRAVFGAGVALFLSSAVLAQVPRVMSRKAMARVKADGAIGDWSGADTVRDAKSGIEFSFQNDAGKLWILAVVQNAKALESLESTGLTVLAGPAGGKKPARGVLFLVRRISAESYIYWRESQGNFLSDADKEKIREAGPREETFAFAVGARGSTHGPLRFQKESAPPEFGFSGGAAKKILGTKSARVTPPAEQGGLSGVATPAQDFLNNFDSLSRPTRGTRTFAFAVDVKLADKR
jgi:hypothetical protein